MDKDRVTPSASTSIPEASSSAELDKVSSNFDEV